MVGSVLSFWDGPFSGAMLVLGRVTVDASKNFSSISVAGGSRNIVLFSAMISLHLYNLTSIFLMGGSTISYPPVNQLGNEISPFLIGYTIYIFKWSFFPLFPCEFYGVDFYIQQLWGSHLPGALGALAFALLLATCLRSCFSWVLGRWVVRHGFPQSWDRGGVSNLMQMCRKKSHCKSAWSLGW